MAKWLITTPNRRYCGVTEGVPFVDGRAVVHDEILKNVLVNNYKYSAELIEEEKVKAAETPAPAAPKRSRK